jgi:predicted nucleotidyltransferase component of viral defense system
MKPLLIDQLRGQPDAFRSRSVTREFLQARILLSLQDHGAFSNWAFVGGTSLRFLFNLPRYSEDLDFSLTPAGGDARFERLIRAVRADLQAEAYTVEIKVRADKTVASAMIKFRGLLHELGISPMQDETIGVKIEIDTNPPGGAGTAIKSVRRHFMLNLQHYDCASLLAGKLHAVLSRKYTKGRDLYDLAWYLADPAWPEPNIPLLVNALGQSHWQGDEVTASNWRKVVADKLRTLDWKAALKDVSPFLERTEDAAWISPERLHALLLA